MAWTIIAVGKLKKGAAYDLCQTYVKRCATPIRIIEIDGKNIANSTLQKQSEADSILKHIPKDAIVIVLDERGKTMSSPDFATHIQHLHTQGANDIYFIIGGAFGVSPQIHKCAHMVLSFGKMTLPHMLVRVILCEQLYRIRTILDGHPYHKV